MMTADESMLRLHLRHYSRALSQSKTRRLECCKRKILYVGNLTASAAQAKNVTRYVFWYCFPVPVLWGPDQAAAAATATAAAAQDGEGQKQEAQALGRQLLRQFQQFYPTGE